MAKPQRKQPTNVTLRMDLASRAKELGLIPVKKYGKPITRLHPTATISGVEYVLKFHDLAAVPADVLTRPVASLAARGTELVAAIDLLFTGV